MTDRDHIRTAAALLDQTTYRGVTIHHLHDWGAYLWELPGAWDTADTLAEARAQIDRYLAEAGQESA